MEYTRDRVPQLWAGTNNSLGNALWRLGEREGSTPRLEETATALFRIGELDGGIKRLEKVADAFREALRVYTRNQVPLQWAITQNNLGNVQQLMAQRTGQPPCDAIRSHFEALLIFESSSPQYAAAARQRLAEDLMGLRANRLPPEGDSWR